MKPVTNRLLPVLQASMEIRTATKVNGWLYFIKKLPIVGKRIPDRVYRWQTLKTVLAYITLPARFIGLWFGKALYVLLMAALPAILAAGEENLSAAYPYALHALVFLSLVSGTFQSRALLSSDADRYVCLRLMRLPPRPYLLAQYLVEIGKDAVGFLPVLTLGAFLLGGSPWDGLLCALEITALHAAGEAAHLAWFKLRGGAPGRLGGFKLLPIAAALVLAYLPLMLGRDWGIGRLAVSLPMVLVCLAAGAAGFAYVWRYPRFTLVAMRTAKAEDLADLEEAKTRPMRRMSSSRTRIWSRPTAGNSPGCMATGISTPSFLNGISGCSTARCSSAWPLSARCSSWRCCCSCWPRRRGERPRERCPPCCR